MKAGGHLTASSHCDYNRAAHLSELPLKYTSVQRIQRKRIYQGPCSGIMSYEKRFLAGLIIILAVIGWQGLQPATLLYVPCFQHSRNDGLVQGTMFLKSIGTPLYLGVESKVPCFFHLMSDPYFDSIHYIDHLNIHDDPIAVHDSIPII